MGLHGMGQGWRLRGKTDRSARNAGVGKFDVKFGVVKLGAKFGVKWGGEVWREV